MELNKAVYLSVYEREPGTGKPLTQEKIADRLSTTREQVNRYLQRARQRGLLRSEYVPPSEEMLDRVFLELNYTDITAVLRDFAEHHRAENQERSIQSVTVVPTSEGTHVLVIELSPDVIADAVIALRASAR